MWSGCPSWRLREGRADPRFAGVVPGGLDQQSAGELDPVFVIDPCRSLSPDCERDGVSPSQLPTRVGFLEPCPVGAELEVDRERGERVHAAERAQPGDGRPPRRVGRELADPLGEHLLAGGQPVHARDQVRPRQLLTSARGTAGRRASGDAPASRSTARDRPGRGAAASSRRDGARSSDPAGTRHARASAPVRPRPASRAPRPGAATRRSDTARAARRPCDRS